MGLLSGSDERDSTKVTDLDQEGREIEDAYARIDHVNWNWGYRPEGED